MLFTLTAINQNGNKAFFSIEFTMYTNSGFFYIAILQIKRYGKK